PRPPPGGRLRLRGGLASAGSARFLRGRLLRPGSSGHGAFGPIRRGRFLGPARTPAPAGGPLRLLLDRTLEARLIGLRSDFGRLRSFLELAGVLQAGWSGSLGPGPAPSASAAPPAGCWGRCVPASTGTRRLGGLGVSCPPLLPGDLGRRGRGRRGPSGGPGPGWSRGGLAFLCTDGLGVAAGLGRLPPSPAPAPAAVPAPPDRGPPLLFFRGFLRLRTLVEGGGSLVRL